jgi:antitoxin VapB
MYRAMKGDNMKIGSVFENNRTQAVRLPAETRFPKNVKKVTVRIIGDTRVISPVKNTWDDFFLSSDNTVTDDFMVDRASQFQSERESF